MASDSQRATEELCAPVRGRHSRGARDAHLPPEDLSPHGVPVQALTWPALPEPAESDRSVKTCSCANARSASQFCSQAEVESLHTRYTRRQRLLKTHRELTAGLPGHFTKYERSQVDCDSPFRNTRLVWCCCDKPQPGFLAKASRTGPGSAPLAIRPPSKVTCSDEPR